MRASPIAYKEKKREGKKGSPIFRRHGSRGREKKGGDGSI